MVTQNRRVVSYLPVPYHDKLREYMKEESLTESAAIVKILKQFFDGTPKVDTQDDEIASLKADMAQLQQRLAILEQAVMSGQRFSKSTTSHYRTRQSTVLPPQSGADLARRLGTSPSTVEEASQKGESYFRDWSKRRDPNKRAWQKRGELFHPLSD